MCNIEIKKISRELIETQKEIYKLYNDFISFYKNCDILNQKQRLSYQQQKEIAVKLELDVNLIGDPSKLKDNINLFKKYIDSYLQSIMIIFKDIKGGNDNLIYSYFFLLTHYVELCLKTSLLQQNKDFKKDHKVEQLLKTSGDYIKKIGIKDKYYNYLQIELKELNKFAKNADFSMAFRYPLDKNYKELIINPEINKLTHKEILRIINKHKKLLLICQLLVKKSEKYYLNDLLEKSIKFESDAKNIVKNI